MSRIGRLKEQKTNSFWACWVQGALFPKQYSKSFFFRTTSLLSRHLSLSANDASHFTEKADTYLVLMSAFFSLERLYLHMWCFLLMVRVFHDSPIALLALSSLSVLCLQSLPYWPFCKSFSGLTPQISEKNKPLSIFSSPLFFFSSGNFFKA